MIGDKHGRNDEDAVHMGESFGPSFMKEPRGKSNPFKALQDKGLIAPSSYRQPDQVEENYMDDKALQELGKKTGDTAGQFASAFNQIEDIKENQKNNNAKNDLSTDDIANYQTNVNVGEKVWTTGKDEKGEYDEWTQETTTDTSGDADRPSAEETYPNVDHDKFPTLESYKDYIKDYWQDKKVDTGKIYKKDDEPKEEPKETEGKVSDRHVATSLEEKEIDKGSKSQQAGDITTKKRWVMKYNPRTGKNERMEEEYDVYEKPTSKKETTSAQNRNAELVDEEKAKNTTKYDEVTTVGVSEEDHHGKEDGSISEDYTDSQFNKSEAFE